MAKLHFHSGPLQLCPLQTPLRVASCSTASTHSAPELQPSLRTTPSKPAPSFSSCPAPGPAPIPLPVPCILPMHAATSPLLPHPKSHETATSATKHEWPLTSVHCSSIHAKTLKSPTPHPLVIWEKTEACRPQFPTPPLALQVDHLVFPGPCKATQQAMGPANPSV